MGIRMLGDGGAPGRRLRLLSALLLISVFASTGCGEETPEVDAEWVQWSIPPDSPDHYQLSEDTVQDLVTGLLWQRTLPETCHTLSAAATYCDELHLDDRDGWRLPTAIELRSIRDLGRHGPSINTNAFPSTPGEWFWSSTPHLGGADSIWAVSFYLGHSSRAAGEDEHRVRCVLSSSPASNGTGSGDRYEASDGVVYDRVTELLWQRELESNAYTWAEARTLCESLDLDGKRDWRLPRLLELESLIDVRASSPAVDIGAFPETPVAWFWSGTPQSGDPSRAWAVHFEYGHSSAPQKDYNHRVRCVR